MYIYIYTYKCVCVCATWGYTTGNQCEQWLQDTPVGWWLIQRLHYPFYIGNYHGSSSSSSMNWISRSWSIQYSGMTDGYELSAQTSLSHWKTTRIIWPMTSKLVFCVFFWAQSFGEIPMIYSLGDEHPMGCLEGKAPPHSFRITQHPADLNSRGPDGRTDCGTCLSLFSVKSLSHHSPNFPKLFQIDLKEVLHLAVPRSASQASSTAACPWYHAGASRSSRKKWFPGRRRVAVKVGMVGGSSHESFLLSGEWP